MTIPIISLTSTTEVDKPPKSTVILSVKNARSMTASDEKPAILDVSISIPSSHYVYLSSVPEGAEINTTVGVTVTWFKQQFDASTPVYELAVEHSAESGDQCTSKCTLTNSLTGETSHYEAPVTCSVNLCEDGACA